MIAISVFLLNWQPLEMLAYGLLYTAVVLTLWSTVYLFKSRMALLNSLKLTITVEKAPFIRGSFVVKYLS